MKPGLRRQDAYAIKPVTDDWQARRMIRLTRYLRGQGVKTPPVAFDPAAHHLVFPWIEGESGRQIATRFSLKGDFDPAGFCLGPHIRQSLATLAVLHRIPPPTAAFLPLSPLNPWKRIYPRLRRLTPGSRLHGKIRRLLDVLPSRLQDGKAVVIHGDYHLGQVIFDTPNAPPWLIDLEDVVLAPCEADLGNFAAYLVTAFPDSSHPAEGFQRLLGHLVSRYSEASGSPLAPRRIEAYGAAALLRRALKFLENGSASPLRIIEILEAADALIRF